MTTERHVEYIPLKEIEAANKNPKAHDLGALHTSIGRFNFGELPLIDDRTGRLVAGHGRIKALKQMRAKSAHPPEGVKLGNDGEWLVPVVRGWASKDDAEADSYLLASNRTTELGGWEVSELADMLKELERNSYLLASNRTTELGGWEDSELADMLKELERNSTLEGTGFDADDLDEMIKAETIELAEDVESKDSVKCPQCGFEVPG